MLGKYKWLRSTFLSHIAQILGTDDGFEQLLDQTECRTKEAKNKSDNTVNDCLTWSRNHSKVALRVAILQLWEVVGKNCCNDLLHLLNILSSYLPKISTNKFMLDKIKKNHQSCVVKNGVVTGFQRLKMTASICDLSILNCRKKEIS